MRLCFTLALLAAQSIAAATVVKQARSVVRVDTRTGRLIRAVVIAPRPIQPRTAAARSYEPTSAGVSGTVREIVEQTAKAHDIDPLLVHSVIAVESNYDPYAVSPKGAQGLMQLIPATARRFGAHNSFDAKQNIEAGVKYLKHLSTLYPNDLRLTLAAYNAGEGAVAKYGNSIPPYPETEQYVYKVGSRYGKARRAAERSRSAAAAVEPPSISNAGDSYRPVHSFVDSDGRLHLMTLDVAPTAATP